MKPFKFNIDLQQGEEVIIRSAEQPGVVEEIIASSVGDRVLYLVRFQYASVYLGEKDGYDSDRAWFSRKALRKIV